MRKLACAVLLLVIWVSPGFAGSELFSKRYAFRSGVILEMGVSGPDGIRLDTVQFDLPARVDGKALRTSGVSGAEVAVSNTGGAARKIGVAIALFDDSGRLLGVASGGSKVGALRPERQKTFALVFDGVNAEIHDATAFQISLEAKP